MTSFGSVAQYVRLGRLIGSSRDRPSLRSLALHFLDDWGSATKSGAFQLLGSKQNFTRSANKTGRHL